MLKFTHKMLCKINGGEVCDEIGLALVESGGLVGLIQSLGMDEFKNQYISVPVTINILKDRCAREGLTIDTSFIMTGDESKL